MLMIAAFDMPHGTEDILDGLPQAMDEFEVCAALLFNTIIALILRECACSGLLRRFSVRCLASRACGWPCDRGSPTAAETLELPREFCARTWPH